MAHIEMACCHCGFTHLFEVSRVNRALSIGAPLYCGKECAGLARRTNKTPEQKRAEKAAYDASRRERLANQIKAQKSAHHRRTYDPIKAAQKRQERMPRHVEYCRRPEYVAWKADYDAKRRARQNFGEFADAFLLLQDVEREIECRATRYEVYQQNGTLNKAQTRRRSL